MNAGNRWIALSALTMAPVCWLSGCAGNSKPPEAHQSTKADHTHEEGDHKADGHVHKDGSHHDAALTEKDVKLPDSFTGGVAREKELHEQIEHLIEHGELAKVHRVAEEMALVAKHMKELARKDLPDEKQVEAGRLCNELAAFYPPIDEVADAGKKAETQAIHSQMAATIAKLRALTE